jgi:GYF domain 2
MEEERSWYYLQHSRQLGPFTWNELQDLLGMNVISPATLVWRQGGGGWRTIDEVARRRVTEPAIRRPRSWMLIVGGIIFCAAMSFGAEFATQRGSEQQISNFFPLTATTDTDEALDGGADPLATSSVSAVTGEGNASQPSWLARSPTGTMNPAPPHLRRKGHFVQEYWRAISHSKVIGRYEYYLRRAPAGSFAQIAAARIEELRQVPPKRAGGRARKRPAAKQATPPAKPPKLASGNKPASDAADTRCWGRNMEACRQKCREGDHRACHKLRRLGG